jgi:hypothetical protein
MAYVGIDGHKKQSQMCLLTAVGEILPQRIPTPREECAVVCASAPQLASRSDLVDRAKQGRGLQPGGARLSLLLDRRRRMG